MPDKPQLPRTIIRKAKTDPGWHLIIDEDYKGFDVRTLTDIVEWNKNNYTLVYAVGNCATFVRKVK